MAVTKGAPLTAWSAVFTLGNCAIGAGILSFPYAFKCAGLLGGLLLTFGVAIVVIATASTVVHLAQQYRANTYQVLVAHILGPAASNALAVVTTLYLFGACVAYLIIIGETFRPLVERVVSDDSWLADRRTLTTLWGFLVVLPLSLNRTLGAIAAASSFAIAVMAYTSGAVVFRSCQLHSAPGHPWVGDDVELFGGWRTLEAIPIMVFAFQCHVQSVLIYAELTPRPVLLTCLPGKQQQAVPEGSDDEGGAGEQGARAEATPNQTKLTGMFRVLAVGVGMVGTLYTLVGVFGYLAFPLTVSSNILTSFSANDTLIQVARAFVGCAVVCHYPATHHAARAAFDDLLRAILHLAPSPQIPWSRLVPETVIFFLTSYLLAISVDDLGVVFKLLGGTGATLLILVMPGAMLLVLGLTQPGEAPRRSSGATAEEAAGPLLHAVQGDRSPSAGSGSGSDESVVMVTVEAGPSGPSPRVWHSPRRGRRRARGCASMLVGRQGALGRRRALMVGSGLLLLLLGVGLFANTLTNIVMGNSHGH